VDAVEELRHVDVRRKAGVEGIRHVREGRPDVRTGRAVDRRRELIATEGPGDDLAVDQEIDARDLDVVDRPADDRESAVGARRSGRARDVDVAEGRLVGRVVDDHVDGGDDRLRQVVGFRHADRDGVGPVGIVAGEEGGLEAGQLRRAARVGREDFEYVDARQVHLRGVDDDAVDEQVDVAQRLLVENESADAHDAGHGLAVPRRIDRSERLGAGATSQETRRCCHERQNPERLPVHAHSSPKI
jgi:hypothetical protein